MSVADMDNATEPGDGSLPTDGPTIRLHFACSPLNYVTAKFNPGAWTGAVGARFVSKSMSSDFVFESGVEMQEIGCGVYELLHANIAVDEEFGFFVYPIGQEGSDEKTISDIGCDDAGSSKCPAFAVPAAAVGMQMCTKKTTYGEDSFFNRVYDGLTVDYTWGSCSNSCAQAHPTGCVSDPAPASDLPQQDQPDIPVPALGVTMPAFPKLGANHRQAFTFWRVRVVNDDLSFWGLGVNDVQFFTDKSNYVAGVQQYGNSTIHGTQPLSGECFESDHYNVNYACAKAFDGLDYTLWIARRSDTGTEPGSLGVGKRFTWAYIGLRLPQPENVQHVRINNFVYGGKPSFSQTGAAVFGVECSDDGDRWYEWAGPRITASDKSVFTKQITANGDTFNVYDIDRYSYWEDIVK